MFWAKNLTLGVKNYYFEVRCCNNRDNTKRSNNNKNKLSRCAFFDCEKCIPSRVPPPHQSCTTPNVKDGNL